MNKDLQISRLEKDESGKLRGGFSIQSVNVSNQIFATNGNCMGGGWGDTNTNCTGTCNSCSVNDTLRPSTKP